MSYVTYVMLLFLLYILVISFRPIISTSTEPTFTKFTALVKLCPQMNELKYFFDISREVAAATNFVGKIDLQFTPCSFNSLQFCMTFARALRRHTTKRAGRRKKKLPDSMDAGEPIK